MANYNESLEAVDCHLHSVRYDMAVNSGAGCRLSWQKASSGHLRLIAMPIRPKIASAVTKMLLYYHGQLFWVTRSS
eukprot:scaffold1808_cov93-Skeletonema_dohrnii-CCMP3373.AAC.1